MLNEMSSNIQLAQEGIRHSFSASAFWTEPALNYLFDGSPRLANAADKLGNAGLALTLMSATLDPTFENMMDSIVGVATMHLGPVASVYADALYTGAKRIGTETPMWLWLAYPIGWSTGTNPDDLISDVSRQRESR